MLVMNAKKYQRPLLGDAQWRLYLIRRNAGRTRIHVNRKKNAC